ncbi:MAG: hypothetical protein H0T40_16125 [Geodermatophilaceae bacterium]|nr:hypothetical protein [Geodermatophilaceae bacterium]
MSDLALLAEDMKAAGAWVFNGGLHPSSTATVVQPKDGDVLTTDGPYLEGKEHIGGFTVIQAADLDSALEWGRKLARVLTIPIEVRRTPRPRCCTPAADPTRQPRRDPCAMSGCA